MSTVRKPLLERVKDHLVETIYPARCMACPSETITPMGLCGSCWGETHFFEGAVCHYCGVSVPTAADPSEKVVCDSCHRHPPGWDMGRSAIAYEGRGRQIAMAFKHADRLDMARTLAAWMTQAGSDILSPDMLVVPVPLHWSRLLRRRYNQAAVLAQHVADTSGADYAPELVKRRYATPSLQGKTRGERHDVLSNAMTVLPANVSSVTDRSVLLVDDVLTTGATLSACTEVCRKAGAANVSVLTLARVARAE